MEAFMTQGICPETNLFSY